MAVMAVKPIPDSYRSATPYLCCRGAARAIEFYTKAFGAVEVFRIGAGPGDTVGHAEIKIGEATIMLADEFPQMGFVSPQALGGSAVVIHVYVQDVDAFVARAAAAGATVKRPPADQFYGDRSSQVVDPFGHSWSFATRKEDLTHEEMRRRAAQAHGG